MAQSEMHLLFQQMGEVLAEIRALHATIDLRQAQVEQLHNLARTDMAALRHDQRELEEKFECIVSVVQHEVEALRGGTADNARSLAEMTSAVESLQRPIAEILRLKSRVAGIVFAAGLVGSAILWLAEPAYSWLLNASFTRH